MGLQICMDWSVVMKPEVLTFNCYGTLIDWKQGIFDTAGPSVQKIDADLFLIYGAASIESLRLTTKTGLAGRF